MKLVLSNRLLGSQLKVTLGTYSVSGILLTPCMAHFVKFL